MKKSEIFIIGGLIMLAVAWPQLANKFYKAPPVPPGVVGATNTVSSVTSAVPGKVTSIGATPVPVQTATNTAATVTNVVPVAPVASLEGSTHELYNELLRLEVSTVGAAITEADLLSFPDKNDGSTEPVVFDFHAHPSLVYTGIAGLGTDAIFTVKEVEPGRTLELSTRTPQGVQLVRTLTISDSYVVDIVDTLSSEGGQTLVLPKYDIQMGPVAQLPDVYAFGFSIGVDALLQRGEGIEHFGKKLQKWLKKSENGSFDDYLQRQVDWVAVKNKFFCHILTIKEGDLAGSRDFRVRGTWNPEKKMAREGSTSIQFEGFNLVPGQSYVREYSYFVGPKKLKEIQKLEQGQDAVMEFWGFIAPISRVILRLMNFAYDHVWPHNYGLAIILLTLFIRGLFWPLTQKSNKSMKKMQALAPEMTALREKFKDNPQKQHEAVMGLYKKHKVNPLSGCLPMLIQFPVFIALFYVIRTAVELRFAPFLWISDLSEPERILFDTLNFPLNILPVAMAATMYVQQKLTPTTMDPAQAKVMQFFPIMLLFFLYNMPSGLLLYWTTSNLLMIAQQMHNLRHLDDVQIEVTPPAPAKASGGGGGGGKKKSGKKKK